jgi:hypothetical protein
MIVSFASLSNLCRYSVKLQIGVDLFMLSILSGMHTEFGRVHSPRQGLSVRVSQGRGRTIAQAVSRGLPTAAARVRARVKSCGICGGQRGTGAGFLRVLKFPLPIRIPPIAPQSSSVIWGWYSMPNSGRSTKWTQSHPMRKKNSHEP